MFLEVGRPESVGDTVASLTMCGSVSCKVPGAGEGEGQPGSPCQGAELCLSSLLLMSDLLTGSQGRGRGAAGLPSGVLLRRHPSSAKTVMQGRASPVGFRITSDHLDRIEHWLVPSKAHLPGDAAPAPGRFCGADPASSAGDRPLGTGHWKLPPCPGQIRASPENRLPAPGRMSAHVQLSDLPATRFSEEGFPSRLPRLPPTPSHPLLRKEQPTRASTSRHVLHRGPPLPLCGALTRGVGLTVAEAVLRPIPPGPGLCPQSPTSRALR